MRLLQCPQCGSEQAGTFCRQCGTRLRLVGESDRPVASGPAQGAARNEPDLQGGGRSSADPNSSTPQFRPSLMKTGAPPLTGEPQTSGNAKASNDGYELQAQNAEDQSREETAFSTVSREARPTAADSGGAFTNQVVVPPGANLAASSRRRSTGFKIAAVLSLLVAAALPAGAVYWWFVLRAPAPNSGTQVGVAAPASAPPSSASIQSSVTTTPTQISPSGAPSSGATPTPSDTRSLQNAVPAEIALADQRASDLPSLVLDGHWVVQLASKYNGLVDPRQIAANGTNTFYLEDILAEYRALSARFGDKVKLVGGSDFGKRSSRGVPVWITIYDPGPFSNESSVRSWCASAFPNLNGSDLANVCLPRTATPPYS